jgi:hypothetical protein
MKRPLWILVTSSLWLAACGGDADVQTSPGSEVVTANTGCTFRVRYLDPQPADWLLVAIDYSDVAGSFGERGITTACRPVPRDVTTAVPTNWCDTDDCSDGEKRSLLIELFTGQTGDEKVIVGPADVVRCDFHGDPATLEHAIITQTDSTTGTGSYHSPNVELVSDCGGAGATTTSTSSTTSTTECEGSECAGEVLSFALDLDSSTPLQSLQVEMTFPCSAGQFEHLPAEYSWMVSDVFRCDRGDLDVGLWATAEHTTDPDDPALCSRTAVFGVITTRTLDGPGTVLRCPFLAGSADVDPATFGLRVVDAGGVGLPGPDLTDDVSVSVRFEGDQD